MFVLPQFYQTDTYGYYLLPDTINPKQGVLYNHHYQAVQLAKEEGETFIYDRFMGRFLVAQRRKADGRLTVVFIDTKDLSMGLELSDLPHNTRIDGDLLFYETDGIFDRVTVHKIVRLNGQVIYDPSVNQTLFRSMNAALVHPEKVQELQLDIVPMFDLMELTQFPNLEVLKLKRVIGDRIPVAVFDQLPKLRVLHLQHAEDLQSLPAELSEASSLEFIRLSDCPKLTNPMALLQQLPALKRLHTDYPFTPAQRQALHASHPNLIFQEMLMTVPDKN